jgi:replicative DNA helicase
MDSKKQRRPVNSEMGRMPPQDVSIESAILGAVLLESEAIDLVINTITPNAFYDPKHVLIFQAILDLYNANSPVDILTVSKELKKNLAIEQAGGAYYVTSLTNRVASAANIEYHAKVIHEKYVQREIIRICGEIGSDAYSDDCDGFNLLDKAENLLYELRSSSISTSISGDIKESVVEVVNSFDEDHSKELSGVDFGNKKINDITGGAQKSDLILLAARPSVGKTARAAKIAVSAWKNQKKKGILFSLEMSKRQIVQRLLSDAGNFSGNLFRSKDTATEQDLIRLNHGANLVSEYGFEIYDNSSININYIRTVAKRFKKRYGKLDYIIIDYLQLMKSVDKGKGNREQEISQISSSLKAFAKDFDIPVIALSQLSRELEKRADKRPMMSDLRESGSLEQDADLIYFLYKPSNYYDFGQDPDYGNGQDGNVSEENYSQLIEILIAKHRNGSVGDVFKEKFQGEFFKFTEWGSYEYNENEQSTAGAIKPSRLNSFDNNLDSPF